jgi:hypothetical protein
METLALAHTPARLPLTPDTIAGVSVAALSQHWRMGACASCPIHIPSQRALLRMLESKDLWQV